MRWVDVVVVGAGLAGLSSGLELNSRGRKVLLEASTGVAASAYSAEEGS